MTPGQRKTLTVVLLVAVAIGSFMYGRYRASDDLDTSATKIAQLQDQNAKLTVDNKTKAEQNGSLQAQLQRLQDQLTAMFLPVRSLEIRANESVPLAVGQLNVGLIGIPRQESVEINVNGKQQTAVPGDSVVVPFSTSCRVTVRSFDARKASVNVDTACASAPQP